METMVGWIGFFNLLPLLKKLQIGLSILFILYLFDKNWKIERKLSFFFFNGIIVSLEIIIIIKKEKITWNLLIRILYQQIAQNTFFASSTEIATRYLLWVQSFNFAIIILKIFNVNSFLFVYEQSVSD